MDKDEMIDRLEVLCESNDSEWRKKAEWGKENRFWLKKSGKIALSVLNIMNKKGISKKDLADSLDISIEQLHRYLSGNENMDLKTICMFEKTLGIDIIEINMN